MPPRCWPWSHRWTKWKDADSGAVLASQISEPKPVVGYRIRQEKRCEICNKVRIRIEVATV